MASNAPNNRFDPSAQRVLSSFLSASAHPVNRSVDHLVAWPAEQHHQFIKKCMGYIGNLMKDGKLKAAQQLVKEGKIISHANVARDLE